MAIRFKCPSCQRLLRAPDGRAGAAVNCPACNQPLRVPRGAEAPTPAMAPEARPAAGPPPPPRSQPPAVPRLTSRPAAAPRRPRRERRPRSARAWGVALLGAVLLAAAALLLLWHPGSSAPSGPSAQTWPLEDRGPSAGPTVPAPPPPGSAPPVPRVPPPPDLGPAPPLPPVPPDLKWAEGRKGLIERAIRRYPDDQVSAYLVFERMSALKRDKDPLTPREKQWVESAAKATRGRAMAVVKRDSDYGIATRNARLTFIAAAAVDAVEKTILGDPPGGVEWLKKVILTAQTVVKLAREGPAEPVWRLTQVTGEPVGDSYTERQLLMDELRLSAKPGFRFLRVKGRVENISGQSDPPYLPFAIGGMKGAFLGIAQNQDDPAPRRAAVDLFFFLLDGEERLHPCAHVCERCSALRGPLPAPGADRGGGVVWPGTYVYRGEAFDLDVLFAVPLAATKLDLVVLGSAPVPVRLGSP